MKKILLLGIGVLALSACRAENTKQDMKANIPQTQKQTAYQLNKENPMQYNEAGKTDADHLYLEEVLGKKALAKVREWNEKSAQKMQNGVYKQIKSELLEVYNSPDKIPYISYRAGLAHNFWQDDKHVKGIWRTTTLESYRTDNPKWDIVLDIDALAKKENKNWVYKGNNCLAPKYNLCIVNLSDGGKDAVVRREFDLASKSFVKDGFVTSESKGSAQWIDENNLLIGVDFGSGTMTESGYPMINKLWRRGEDLAKAKVLFSGKKTDMGVWPASFENADGDNEILIIRAKTFYTSDYFWIPRTGKNAFKPVRIPVPEKAEFGGQFGDQIIVNLKQDWLGYKSGDMVSFSISDFMKTGDIKKANLIFSPEERQSIDNSGIAKDALLLSIYDNVSANAYAFIFKNGKWQKQKLDFPENGNIVIGATNNKESIAFINTESFLEPDTLWQLDTKSMQKQKLKALPAWFDASNMVAEQKFATSSDGTKIPYYIIHKKDMRFDGKNPTLLYGYGGFEIAINPSYSATIGRAWLKRGGVYVIANIRGGGEFGPKWHQAGLKTKRQIVYDDFIAVAEDLIKTKITSPKHLGIHGRSNGGLLMGVMFTQRPDLFGAVAIGVPLLDMRRYDKLLAGASWVGEYGDPDDEGAEGEFIRKLSPYHNIRPDIKYPVPYIYTSTKDDRVHPAHARKFAKRLEDFGYPFYYYENIDGGHAGAANLNETAHSQALIYSYMSSQLMEK